MDVTVSVRDLELAKLLWETELLGVPVIAEYLAAARAEGVVEGRKQEMSDLRKRLEAWFRYNEKPLEP